MQTRSTWLYQGPVSIFDKCVCNDYVCGTQATSYAEAERNIKHQFRKENNVAKTRPIRLDGVLFRVPKKTHHEPIESESVQLSMFPEDNK